MISSSIVKSKAMRLYRYPEDMYKDPEANAKLKKIADAIEDLYNWTFGLSEPMEDIPTSKILSGKYKRRYCSRCHKDISLLSAFKHPRFGVLCLQCDTEVYNQGRALNENES